MQRERVSAVKEGCEGGGTVSQRARTHFLWADAAAKPAALELVGCELLTGWDCRHRLCVVVVIGRQDRARWHRDSQGSHRRDRNGCDGCDGHGRNWDGLWEVTACTGLSIFAQPWQVVVRSSNTLTNYIALAALKALNDWNSTGLGLGLGLG